MCQPYGLCFLFNSLKLLLFKLICLIEKHEFLKCEFRKYRWQDAKNVKKYALKLYQHIALIISIHFKSIIKVNTNNKKLFVFFPLERKNFRLSAFRGIRLFAHVLIFFVRKHFSKTPGISISPDSCYT